MKSLKYLNKYLWKYKWLFMTGIIFTIVSNYFGVKMPVFIKDTIDELLNLEPLNSYNDAIYLSLRIASIFLGLAVMKGIFLFLMRQTIIIMSRHIEYDLKNEIYEHYQTLDTDFFKNKSIGDLMNRISEDVGLVRMYLGPGIMYTTNLIVLSSMIIFQMITISPSLSFFVLLPLPIMSYLIYRISSKMNMASRQTQETQSKLSSIAQETFSGIKVMKSYLAGEYRIEKFSKVSDEYKEKSMKLTLINSFFTPIMLFLIGTSTLIAVYIGGIMSHQNEISLGAIVAFIFFVNNLTWPFASIGWVTSIVQRADASQSRINEFLETKSKITNPSQASFDFDGSIIFKNVYYTYSNTNIQALKNVSFTLKKGMTLAIVGKTGSGKSTILELIARQIECCSGDILISDQSIKSINLVDYRKQLSIVPQDVFLFSDSIANNISFGTPEVLSLEVIENYAKLAHVHHNIVGFPDKYDTLLGERGVNLSGGQKQRISIARALTREPKLLLLDDCLSAVDTETEEIILKNLHRNRAGRSTVIVSHRVSTIRYADYILYLEKGEIIEEGTHEQLLRKNGKYAEMQKNQME
ncbi:MAG: ABC transporter ATP-binding protein [Bacteroidetes bacterium]|nr:ABC transporter ATP-binding protein [Bacteroidota bacterium]